MTAKEKLEKHCTVTKEAGRRGDVLVYGKHKYRMNRLLANLSEEECQKVVKIIELDAWITDRVGKEATRKKTAVRVEAKPCECGCEAMAKAGSRFLQGHDAKLKSRLRKAAEGGDAKAAAELKQRGW